jgi:hypothetical protein
LEHIFTILFLQGIEQSSISNLAGVVTRVSAD